MSKYCPIVDHKVTYLFCAECEDRKCKSKENKESKETKEKTNYGTCRH